MIMYVSIGKRGDETLTIISIIGLQVSHRIRQTTMKEVALWEWNNV